MYRYRSLNVMKSVSCQLLGGILFALRSSLVVNLNLKVVCFGTDLSL